MGYSPKGYKESDTTERLSTRFLAITGERWLMDPLSFNSELHYSLPVGLTGLKVRSTFRRRQADVASNACFPTLETNDLIKSSKPPFPHL